jgi:hypothetical protein
MTITGNATYDSVPPTAVGGLNFGGVTRKAIRGATVQMIDLGGNVIASATTGADGAYTLTSSNVPASVRVRVRAELKGANFDFTVKDNTSGEALYVMESPSLAAAATATQNMNAASGWGGTRYTGTRVAAPFAILDVAYQAAQKVAQASASTVLPSLVMFWSGNNRPVGGDLASGAIGTSFFTQTQSGQRVLFLLGAENTDTDEFDSPVVAHEIGHYLQSAISRDDSPGGQHSDGEILDMRLAFSEGWGNAWAGMVLGAPTYFDSRNAQQASGFRFSLADPPNNPRNGWFEESTVQHLLYEWHENAAIGFGGIFQALDGLSASPSFTSIFAFNHYLRAARPSAATSINSLAAQYGVNGTDMYGSGETNNGGNTRYLPVYVDYGSTLGVDRQVCLASQRGGGTVADRGNRLGDTGYLRFTLTGSRSITVTRAAGTTDTTDPDFGVLLSTGAVGGQGSSETPNTETVTATLPAGTHALLLRDFLLTNPTAAAPVTQTTRCFNVRIN